MKKPVFALFDCNNFFVSCERVFRPDLERKPVLVLSSNDGCVVARSQEVKDIGIPMGVPYFQIKDIIKDKTIAVFSGNFSLYRDLSRRVMQIIKEVSPVSEQYSIDEAFALYTDTDVDFVIEEVSRIRKQIKQWTGITVSVGIGYTKTAAKVTAKEAKRQPSGVFYGDENWWRDVAGVKKISEVWGIGRSLAVRLGNNQIYTLYDFLITPPTLVREIGGVVLERIWHELHGRSVLPVLSGFSVPQSLTSSQSFSSSTAELSVLKDALAHHVRSVAQDLRNNQCEATLIGVYLFPKRDSGFVRKAVIPVEMTSSTKELIILASKTLVQLYEVGVLYSKVGFSAFGLVNKNEQKCLSLFNPVIENNSNLDDLLDDLQEKFGASSPVFGKQISKAVWQAKSEKKSPSYTTNWREILTVKT